MSNRLEACFNPRCPHSSHIAGSAAQRKCISADARDSAGRTRHGASVTPPAFEKTERVKRIKASDLTLASNWGNARLREDEFQAALDALPDSAHSLADVSDVVDIDYVLGSNRVRKLIHEDGKVSYFKPLPRYEDTTMFGHTPNTAMLSEAATYALAVKMGPNYQQHYVPAIPTVVEIDFEDTLGTLTPHVENVPTQGKERPSKEQIDFFNQGYHRHEVMSALICPLDSNNESMRVDGDELPVVIDNEFNFAKRGDYCYTPSFNSMSNELLNEEDRVAIRRADRKSVV